MPKPEYTISKEADAALERTFADRYKEGSAYHNNFHEDARDDFEFAGLHQWSDDLIADAAKKKFPTLTLDMTGNIVNAVSSSEIVNRFEPKFLPRSQEDQGLADKTTAVARYVRQQAGAEFVDSGAFRDTIVCGVGCAEWYFDESVGTSGRILCNRVPIEEVIWDPASRKQNLDDATWIIRGKWIRLDEYEALFPDAEVPSAPTGDMGSSTSAQMYMWGRSVVHRTSPILFEGESAREGFFVPSKQAVLVFEMQDWTVEAEYTVLDPMTGKEMTLDQEQYDELRKIMADTGTGLPQAAKRMNRRYRRSVFGGDKLIAHEEIPHEGFTHLFMTCFEDQTREGMRWFGLVRKAKDAQKVANRGFSQLLHTLATNPKGAVLAEENAFADPARAEQDWSTPGKFIFVRPGMLTTNAVQVHKGEYPVDAERMALLFLNMVSRVTGIDPSFMGSTQGSGGDLRRVSGTAMSQVIQQGQMMLALPFDSLRKHRMLQGKLLLSYMRVYLPESETVRVIGDMSSPSNGFVEFMRGDLDDVSFDVIVGETPISPSQQEETWRSLTESGALKALLDHGWLDGVGVSMLASGWPEELRLMVRQKAEQQMQMQEQMMMAQGQPGPGGPGASAPPIQ